MPEENKNQGGAQNKLGELFVEFSTKGLPSLLKNLNSVQANFLLSTKAAKEFIDTISKPFKEAGNDAVGLGKMASMLGARKTDISKLDYYFKSKKLNPSLIEDIAKRQQMYANWQGGTGGLDSNFLIGMNKLGLDWTKYNKSFESQLQLTQDIFNRQNQKNAVDRVNIYSLLGANPEWAYANERGDFNLKDAMGLSEEAAENNIRAAEAMAETSAAWQQLKNTAISEYAPMITKGAEAGTNIIKPTKENTSPFLKGFNSQIFGTPAMLLGPAGVAIGVGGGVGKGIRNVIDNESNGQTTGQAAALDLSTLGKILKYEAPKQMGGNNTGVLGELPDLTPAAMNTPAATIPPGMNNLSQNITITNQNNITGDNAQEIATEIARINAQDIEYTQYQLQNLTGI